MFISLTRVVANQNLPLHLNSDHIVAISSQNVGNAKSVVWVSTTITSSSDSDSSRFYVLETPDEIMKQLSN